MSVVQSIIGVAGILAIAAALSERRRAIRPGLVGIAVGIQVVLGALMLRVPILATGLSYASKAVSVLEEAALAGATFMFGYLVTGPAPFEVTNPSGSFIVAFRVLPLILLVSATSAVLFHWGVLPAIIRALAALIKRALRVSGALSFGAAASVFFGIIEGPILVGPYVQKMSRAELFALMTCGMATVAGTVMVLYASVLGTAVDGALGHILIASVLSVPSALAIAHMMIPAMDDADDDLDSLELERKPGGTWGALMRGTEEGTRMVVGIVATLIVLFALVHLANQGLALIPHGEDPAWTLERLVGFALSPLVLAMGIPWSEVGAASELMGTKVVLNEFVAYLKLGAMEDGVLSARSRLVLTYGMCGFANLGSLGILVGGMTPMLPGRQAELAQLAARAVLAGVLATTLTGAVVGIVAP